MNGANLDSSRKVCKPIIYLSVAINKIRVNLMSYCSSLC